MYIGSFQIFRFLILNPFEYFTEVTFYVRTLRILPRISGGVPPIGSSYREEEEYQICLNDTLQTISYFSLNSKFRFHLDVLLQTPTSTVTELLHLRMVAKIVNKVPVLYFGMLWIFSKKNSKINCAFCTNREKLR